MTRKTDKTTALLDELLADCSSPEEILGKNGLLKQLTKGLVERALEGELNAHLGYEPYDTNAKSTSNSRNGKARKQLQTESGTAEIEVPRDRDGRSSCLAESTISLGLSCYLLRCAGRQIP